MPTLAGYEPELWSLDGKPHYSVSAGALEEPVSAIGLGRPGYVLTLASRKWQFRPQATYSVTVMGSKAQQVAKASATYANTIAVANVGRSYPSALEAFWKGDRGGGDPV